MRKVILLFFLSASASLIHAQSVGIGTTAPNPKAALEINSTTRGLLIPSMTSVQRTAISSPPNGLMVYDTDINQFYHYDGTTWRKIINSTYWNQSTTRNWVYNSTDSVGIGTSIPAHRLDVNGNIRSRDDLLADGRVIATGIVSGSSLQTPGNLAVSGIGIVNGNFTTNGNLTTNSTLSVEGTSQLTGNVTTNGDIIVNNTGATLQLRNGSNVNTGYFQLSGNNVRMGTNSGNNSGNMIIRMNGTDRIFVDETGNMGVGVSSPTEKLDVNGNINFDGKLTSDQTGNAPLTPLCWGRLDNVLNGGIFRGTGNLSASRIGTGHYRITCPGITSTTIVIATPYAIGVFIVWEYYGPDQMDIRTYRTLPDGTWELFNQIFTFIMY
ncbi:MAG: hypothetical protein JNK14_18160 [Chitinophagaceae bacterium]|nr:hypothetical protein [Chitinophagaceae bacterium]